jgi:transcriptional regulator with XRE-family HTH domain
MTYTLNTRLLRARIPNIAEGARSVGMRPATLSDLCNGKTNVEHMEVGTLLKVAKLTGVRIDELLISEANVEESFAETIARWSSSVPFESMDLGAPDIADPLPESERLAIFRSLPAVENPEAMNLTPENGAFTI